MLPLPHFMQQQQQQSTSHTTSMPPYMHRSGQQCGEVWRLTSSQHTLFCDQPSAAATASRRGPISGHCFRCSACSNRHHAIFMLCSRADRCTHLTAGERPLLQPARPVLLLAELSE